METLMKNKFAGVAAVAAAGLLALTGCTAPSTNSGGSGNTTTTPSAQSSASPSESSSASSDPSANLVGSGCMDYANMVPEGAGSVTGMAQDPLTVAASNNPLLKTLTAAVSGQLNPKVDLVDTLNGSEFTVFAPVDSAFAKIDAATLETLKTDDAMLSNILTYHVVAGQVAPDKIVGTHKTVQGGEVEVSGSGDNLKVNDSMVICGGVKTANATVYLVDTVLMPPADAMKK